MRFVPLRVIFFIGFIIIFCSSHIYAQSIIKGKIINRFNGNPISYASVRIPESNLGLLSDALGMFSISLLNAKNSDTFFISSVGFSTLKIPVKDARGQSRFYLTEYSPEMENVVLKSFKNEATDGPTSEVAGYFKSWSTKNSGGEIGRIIHVNHDEYKVNKIRFKVNNQCDTCTIRVRIRDLKNGLPDMDVLRDSITTTVNKLSFDDKYSEIDLSNNNVVLKNKYIFISLELLNCKNKKGECSFCYIGTDPGNYLFRKWEFSDWAESTEHSIYLKLLYNY